MASRFSIEAILKLVDGFGGPFDKVMARARKSGRKAGKKIGADLEKELEEAAEALGDASNEQAKRFEPPFLRAIQQIDVAGNKVGHRLAQGFGRSLSVVRSIAGSVAKIGALGAGAAAAGLTFAAVKVSSIAEDMARVGRAADSLGLPPQFLAALQSLAAEKGIENVDEINRSLEEFQLRLSELRAKNPTGQLFGTLTDIGATDFIKQLRGAKTEMDAVALAFSALSAETDTGSRISLSDALFGGSDQSLDLRRLLETKEAARDILVNYRELSPATEEQIRAAQRFSEAKRQLGTQLHRVSNEIAGALAPAMGEAAAKATAWFQANRELVNQRIGEFAAFVREKIAELIALDWAAWWGRMVELAGDLSAALMAAGKLVLGFGKTALAAGKAIGKTARSLGIDGQALVRIGQLFFTVWAAAKLFRIGLAFAGMAKNALGYVQALREVATGARGAGIAMKAAFAATGVGAVFALTDALNGLIDKLRGARKAIRVAKVEQDFRGQAKAQEAEERAFLAKAEERRKKAGEFVLRSQSLQGGRTGRWARARIAELEAEEKAFRAQAKAVAERRVTAGVVGSLVSAEPTSVEEARAQTGFKQLVAGKTVTPEILEFLNLVKARGGTAEGAGALAARERAIQQEQERQAQIGVGAVPGAEGGAPGGQTLVNFLGAFTGLVRQQEAAADKLASAADTIQRLDDGRRQRQAVGAR